MTTFLSCVSSPGPLSRQDLEEVFNVPFIFVPTAPLIGQILAAALIGGEVQPSSGFLLVTLKVDLRDQHGIRALLNAFDLDQRKNCFTRKLLIPHLVH